MIDKIALSVVMLFIEGMAQISEQNTVGRTELVRFSSLTACLNRVSWD